MCPQQPIQAATLLSAQQELEQPVCTSSYREAHRHLRRMLAESRSLALLSGNSKCGAAYLIDHFLTGVHDKVSIVRIGKPCSDELSFLGALIRAVGFDPTDLTVADLNNVFILYLSFQRKHQRRTILCLEDVQDYGFWLINVIHRIVQLETEKNHGLMVLLSGQPVVNEVLNESLLNAIGSRPEQYVHIANFTLAETREYLRWRVESAGAARIAEVFEFDAITLIHELTAGNADAVSTLGFKCLQLASETNVAPISVRLVNRASKLSDSCRAPIQKDAEIQTLIEDQVGFQSGKLVVRLGGDQVKEFSLENGHVLIGRGKLCDVRIPSPSVSRHHALVVSTQEGAMLIDLESTNGTVVDGQPIKEIPLSRSGVITLGDCDIDFVADRDQESWLMDVHGASKSEPCDAEFATRKLKVWQSIDSDNDQDMLEGHAIKGNINSKGEKIFHVPGTSKYKATKIDESKGERWFHSEDEAIAAGWRAPRIG